MTDWLRRETAPVSAKVWSEIDSIALKMAKQTLVARRITDFDGPRGWGHVANQMDTFRTVSSPQSIGRAKLALPDVMLLTEIRADFSLTWTAIDLFERVGPPLDSEALEEAARDVALAEDRLAFY